ncbi:uncharacterized protein LOC142802915 [Rhipicephalus microplus]|uniref:uncharacterized protein LOC142802915 n=1 Tax=Rhipicephalus microplus TaxID=6941 RepID=UPI003F6D8426
MRLISLAYCVGKVMEHACLNRVTMILEKRDAFGAHIIGFRRRLSTQDDMLQIKEQVVNAPNTHARTLLGLDLKSAFDTVKHTAISDKISQLGLGSRIHRYVSSLVTGRKVMVEVDGAPARTVDMRCSEALEDQLWAILRARAVAEDLKKCSSNDMSLAS